MSSELIKKAALEWITKNTTFDVNIEPLPTSVELFIEKYGEVMGLRAGVSSESISGLSQSFNTSNIANMLKQYASELIGEEYVLPDVKVFMAEKRWK